MGRASMRKWERAARKAREAVASGEYGSHVADVAFFPASRSLALHMRLRERKRRKFWRNPKNYCEPVIIRAEGPYQAAGLRRGR